MNLVLLIARLFFGFGMAVHGSQKLFGWFGGHGLSGTGAFFESRLGFHPGRLFALAAGLGELGSGVLVALGLLGPFGPALMVLVMVVAILTVHLKAGFLSTNNGAEMPLLYAMGASLLAFVGPGAWSLDSLLGLTVLTSTTNATIALALGAAAGVAASFMRHDPTAASAASAAVAVSR